MASIAKRRQRRADGTLGPVRWRVRWVDPDGRERHRTFQREDDAKRFRRRVEGDVESGAYVDAARARETVDAWTREWRRSVVDLRPSSLARLDVTVRSYILPEFGGLPLSAVSNADVRAWAAQLRANGVSPSSVRKAVFALRRIMAAAVADRRLAVNPAEQVPLPTEERGEQRFLSPAEVDALADAIAPRYRALVLVAAYGGLRSGELAALRRRRVDLLRGRVQVAETLVEVGGQPLRFGPPKTRNSRRMVPLPRRVVRELDDHLGKFVSADAEALVFTTLRGGPLRKGAFRRDAWLPAIRAAGLDELRVHDLRHTFVSLWVAAGRNPKEISVRAGHSSVAVTLERYGHLYEDADDSLADRLDALLDPPRRRDDDQQTG